MTSDSTVRQLLDEALGAFDAPNASVAANLRRASRIAANRRDYVHQLWLQYEQTDMTNAARLKTQDPATMRIRATIESLLGVEEGSQKSFEGYEIWERNRSVDQDGNAVLRVTSAGQLENELAIIQRTYEDIAATPAVSLREADKVKAQMLTSQHQLMGLLDRIRTATHTFLVATEAELDAGQAESPLFLRAQEYINAALAKIAPDALAKFVAAQERLYSANDEDLAHALTSCRRMIKALADALYPPTDATIRGDDGVERKMSDDAYRNRLVQYVRDSAAGGTHAATLQASLDSLGSRLKSLDSLASKGVHDKVTVSEAETCVLWTYLLAGDLVRIADGSSGLFSDAGANS